MYAVASSSFKSLQHEPKSAVDHNTNSYWMSEPGQRVSWLKIIFDKPRTTKKILIEWEYIP